MSEGQDQFDRLLGPDAERPTLREQLPREEREWLEDTGTDLTALVRFARLKDSYREAYRAILEVVYTDRQGRGILQGVWEHNGSARYDDLEPYTTLSRRRLRERVDGLEDAGVLSRSQDRAVWVQWETEGVRILAEDALYYFYEAGP